MRVMLDTNILISAVLFPGGRTAQALLKAFSPPYEPVICDYVVDELHRKFQEKFPDKTTLQPTCPYRVCAHAGDGESF